MQQIQHNMDSLFSMLPQTPKTNFTNLSSRPAYLKFPTTFIENKQNTANNKHTCSTCS